MDNSWLLRSLFVLSESHPRESLLLPTSVVSDNSEHPLPVSNISRRQVCSGTYVCNCASLFRPVHPVGLLHVRPPMHNPSTCRAFLGRLLRVVVRWIDLCQTRTYLVHLFPYFPVVNWSSFVTMGHKRNFWYISMSNRVMLALATIIRLWKV